MKEMRGYLITFEGIEGAGKSTQAARLFEVLKSKGYPVVLTREPGGTPIGERIRDLLKDTAFTDMAPLTELFLFAAARHQHVQQVISPMLGEGKIVLCDRFADASLAYQGYGREIHLTQVREVNEMAAWNVRPDLTFLFDLEPYYAIGRVRDRLKESKDVPLDRLDQESVEFYERVRHGYLNLAFEEPQRFRKLDSSQDLDAVHGQVLDCTLRELNRNWGDPQRLELRRMTF